jgi:hypothetical protein
MNVAIIFAVALGCMIVELLWPAMKLPRVNAWCYHKLLQTSGGDFD